MSRRPLPEVVFFDCDGVILESAKIKSDAFATLFADVPEHVDAIVALHEREGGISRYRKFEWIYRDLLDRPLDTDESAALGARYSEIVLDDLLRCPLVPGVVPCLEALAESICVVVSGSPHDELVHVLEQRGLVQHFSHVFGAPHEKAPSMAEVLADRQVSASRAVMIGDAESDLRAAAALRLPFIGRVPAGERSPFPPATTTLADLTQLVDILLNSRIPPAAPGLESLRER